MMRSLLFVMLLFSIQLMAIEESSCVQKLEELENLKAESVSGLEKAALYLTLNTITFSRMEEEKVRKEKIRVLEMELKSCR